MKSWLRFFGLSFFSDKIAKEARVRGVLNCVLGFVLAIVFIYCGVLAANTVPFYAHYNNAEKFRGFVQGVLERVEISIDGGRASADTRVDTFANTTDASDYQAYGYNLVVDTRPSTALDDFEAYCVYKDGETQIPYEDYRVLSEEEQKNYTFVISYTPEELTLTDELVEGYSAYLNGCGDGDITSQYADLAADKENMSEEEFNGKVYALYIKAYYPDITNYERAGDVPLLRSYYYRNYLNSNDIEKTLIIFEDVLFGFFETDGGLSQVFYGSYEKIADGAVTAQEASADAFIKGVFATSVNYSANVYLMNTVRFIPLIAIVPLILAIAAKLVYMSLKDEKFRKYTVCLKMQFACVAMSGLLTALITFICGFFVSNAIVNTLPLIIYAAVMTVRTVASLAVAYSANKKLRAERPAAAEDSSEN